MPNKTPSSVPKSFSLDLANTSERVASWSGMLAGGWESGIDHKLELIACDRPILPWFSHEIRFSWRKGRSQAWCLLYQGQHDFEQIPEYDINHLAVLICQKFVEKVIIKLDPKDPRLTWHQPFEPYEAAFEKLHGLAIKEYLKRLSAYPTSFDDDRQEQEFHLFELKKRKRKWDLCLKSDKCILRRRQLPEDKGSEWWAELFYGLSSGTGMHVNRYAICLQCNKTIASESNLENWKSHALTICLLKKVQIGEERNKRGILVRKYGWRHVKKLYNQGVNLETVEFVGNRFAQILCHFLARDLLNQRFDSINWDSNVKKFVEKIQAL